MQRDFLARRKRDQHGSHQDSSQVNTHRSCSQWSWMLQHNLLSPMPTSLLPLAKCNCGWPVFDMELVWEKSIYYGWKPVVPMGYPPNFLYPLWLALSVGTEQTAVWGVPDANCPHPMQRSSPQFLSLFIILWLILCPFCLHKMCIWEPGNFLCLWSSFMRISTTCTMGPGAWDTRKNLEWNHTDEQDSPAM